MSLPVLWGTPIDQAVLAGVSAGVALVIGMAVASFTMPATSGDKRPSLDTPSTGMPATSPAATATLDSSAATAGSEEQPSLPPSTSPTGMPAALPSATATQNSSAATAGSDGPSSGPPQGSSTASAGSAVVGVPQAWRASTCPEFDVKCYHVAVIGAAKAGKSTFIKAVTKCSSQPEEVIVPLPYTYSGVDKRLVYWDTPSYGTARSPASTLWEDCDLGCFNLLLVLYKEALDQDTLGVMARALEKKVRVFACHAQFDRYALPEPDTREGDGILTSICEQSRDSFKKMTEHIQPQIPCYLVSAHDIMVQESGDPNALPEDKEEALERLTQWRTRSRRSAAGAGSIAAGSSSAQDDWRKRHCTIFDEDALLSELSRRRASVCNDSHFPLPLSQHNDAPSHSASTL